MTKFSPTEEQAKIIGSDAPVIVTRALAGTGKTSTLRGFTSARPDRRFLYLVFNKANQAEARATFSRNTVPMTSHALAYKFYGSRYRHKLGDLRPVFVSQFFGCNYELASLITRLVGRFTSSSASSFSQMSLSRQDRAALPYAERLWMSMCDASDTRIQMTHDGYLKLFALEDAPVTGFDGFLFDEAQDANPITVSIVSRLAQRMAGAGSQLVIVGDDNQSIYSFRGAVNALACFSGENHSLTIGFRFGQAVADAANAVLFQCGERLRLKGQGGPSQVHLQPVSPKGPYTFLARTNADVLAHALSVPQVALHFVGGIETYRVDRVLDAFAMSCGEHDAIEDREIRQFRSIEALSAYAEETSDAEIKGIVNLVAEYGPALPALIADLRRRGACPAAEARITLTTAHRSKGLEWDNVILGEFFEWSQYRRAVSEGRFDEFREELNLLYVATTRARKHLVANGALRHAIREFTDAA